MTNITSIHRTQSNFQTARPARPDYSQHLQMAGYDLEFEQDAAFGIISLVTSFDGVEDAHEEPQLVFYNPDVYPLPMLVC